MSEAFRQGIDGYAQDIFVQGHAWDFDPRAIHCPTIFAHGEHDTLVPIAHSRHTAAVVSGATLRIVPGQGHLIILSALPELTGEMASRDLRP